MASGFLHAVTPGSPVRMCVGCRVRAPKPELLRVVGAGIEIVPDPQARLPGRGAYLHPSQRCFEQALRRRVFARALRLPGPVVTARLEQYLADADSLGKACPGGQPGQAGR
jgi:predicted RNA-binding protein YlxR (DUF448 family)